MSSYHAGDSSDSRGRIKCRSIKEEEKIKHEKSEVKGINKPRQWTRVVIDEAEVSFDDEFSVLHTHVATQSFVSLG